MKTIIILLLTSCSLYAQSIGQAVFYFQSDSLTTSQIKRIKTLSPEQVTVYSDSTHMEQHCKAAKSATGIEPKRIYSDERKISVIWLNK